MEIEFVDGKETIWMDTQIPKIIWERGELEALRRDVEQNYGDLSKLKPASALNLLRLWSLSVADADRDRKLVGCWHILQEEEMEVLSLAFRGYSQFATGLVLCILAERVSHYLEPLVNVPVTQQLLADIG